MIALSNHTLINPQAILGFGAYGQVVEGKFHRKQRAAVKATHCRPVKSVHELVMYKQATSFYGADFVFQHSDGEYYYVEGDLLRFLTKRPDCPPSILPLFEEFLIPLANSLPVNYIVTPFVQTTLLDYLTTDRKFVPFSESETRFIFLQVLQSVAFIHSLNLAHRDIKLENILFDPVSGRIWLADWGFAAFFHTRQPFSCNMGSRHYTAPEIVTSTPYIGPEPDIWASAVVLFALVVGRFPFTHPQHITDPSHLVSLPPRLSGNLRHLLCRMFDRNHVTRINCREIQETQWMNEI